MPGGHLQLMINGSNSFIIGNPQITFFKIVYRRHTNFALECIQQELDGSSDFDSTLTATINNQGDLLHRMWIDYNIFDNGLKNFTALSTGSISGVAAARGTCLTNLPAQLIDHVTIEIGGNTLDKHTGDWLETYAELTQIKPKAVQLWQPIGREPRYKGEANAFQKMSGMGGVHVNSVMMAEKSKSDKSINDILNGNVYMSNFLDVANVVNLSRISSTNISFRNDVANRVMTLVNCSASIANASASINPQIYNRSFTYYESANKCSTIIEHCGVEICSVGPDPVEKYYVPTAGLDIRTDDRFTIASLDMHTLYDGISYTGGDKTIEIASVQASLQATASGYFENGYFQASFAGDGTILTSCTSHPIYSRFTGVNLTPPTYTMHVPLQFWFNRNPGLALPLLAIKKDIKIRLKTESDQVAIGNEYSVASTVFNYNLINSVRGGFSKTPTTPKIKLKLWAEFIYLDEDEKRKFTEATHEYLIEQVQYQREQIKTTNQKFKLNFKNPVKYLAWNIESCNPNSDTIAAYTTPSTSTGALDNINKMIRTGYGQNNPKPLMGYNSIEHLKKGTISFDFNGVKRINEYSNTYFTRTQIQQHFSGGPVNPSGGSLLTTIAGMPLHPTSDVPPPPLFIENVQSDNTEVERVLECGNDFSSAYPDSIGVYSFALYPEKHQPSGVCNFTKLESVHFCFNNAPVGTTITDLKSQTDKLYLRVYAMNYNVLQIKNGETKVLYNSSI